MQKVVVTGVYKKIEIWDEKKWDDYRKDAEKGVEEIVSKLGPLGI